LEVSFGLIAERKVIRGKFRQLCTQQTGLAEANLTRHRSQQASVDLTDPIFNDDAKAWKHFEAIRWRNGPDCPHCGVVNAADPVIGKTARHGLCRRHECRKQFTATVGTVFERSHIPMHK
jgi:hypothetical protein